MSRNVDRYDALGQQYREVEKVLRSYKFPVAVEISCKATFGCILSFKKHNGAWRLMHGDTPLVMCALDVKVHAACRIAYLLERLVEAKEQFVPRVDAAIVELRLFLKECKQ